MPAPRGTLILLSLVASCRSISTPSPVAPAAEGVRWREPFPTLPLGSHLPYDVPLAGATYHCEAAGNCALCEKLGDPRHERLVYCKVQTRHSLPIAICYASEAPAPKSQTCDQAFSELARRLEGHGWARSDGVGDDYCLKVGAEPGWQIEQRAAWAAEPTSAPTATDIRVTCERNGDGQRRLRYGLDRSEADQRRLEACYQACGGAEAKCGDCCARCASQTVDPVEQTEIRAHYGYRH